MKIKCNGDNPWTERDQPPHGQQKEPTNSKAPGNQSLRTEPGMALEKKTTVAMEKSDAPMNMTGRAVMSKLEKNKASRVASCAFSGHYS